MANPAVSTVQPHPEIPDKLYFRIGDVSKLAQVKPFVLRFWESEFPQLGPKKSGTGHRLYRRKDVELVLEIKRLLYDERFTIEGARNHLASKAAAKPQTLSKGKKKLEVAPAPAVQGDLFGSGIAASALEPIREELRSLLQLLR
ncbi:MAG: MerR family transcriptional regulator [Bryobacterales bacterium]|nr:MerR family transcriptional regulator [Bryobacterales bacterium]